MVKFRKLFCNIYKKWNHLLLLSYFAIYLPWFTFLERTITTHFNAIHIAIDDYIPFCEYFVIPYMLWFGYVAWGVTYAAIRNKQDFYKLCTVLFTGMTVFLIISTLYPNGQYLRPRYFERENIFTMMCEWIYSKDTPTNLFPSIHVYNSLAIHFFVMNSEKLKNNRIVRTISFVLCYSIVLSTVFIKQHSVFDVITAIMLAAVMYQGVYVRKWAGAAHKKESKYRTKTRISHI